MFKSGSTCYRMFLLAVTCCRLLPLAVTCCHLLSLAVACCHLLPPAVVRYHLLLVILFGTYALTVYTKVRQYIINIDKASELYSISVKYLSSIQSFFISLFKTRLKILASYVQTFTIKFQITFYFFGSMVVLGQQNNTFSSLNFF